MSDSAERFASSLLDLSRILGIGKSTLYVWRDRGLPKLPDGRYDVDEVRRWVARFRALGDARRGPGNAAASTESIGGIDDAVLAEKVATDVQARKIRVALEALKLQRAKGALVARERVAELLAERASMFRRALDTLVRRCEEKLARASSRPAVRRILEDEIHALLEECYGRPISNEEIDEA